MKNKNLFLIIIFLCAASLFSIGEAANINSDKTPPTIPSALTATAISYSQINLSWQPSTDNNKRNDSGVKGYNIYRNGTYLKQVLAPATSTSDTGLTASTTYSYTVSSVDNAGNESAKSNTASATTKALTTTSTTTTTKASTTTTKTTTTTGTTTTTITSGSGTQIWAKHFGGAIGADSVYAYSVARDSINNIVVVGSCLGNIDFGNGTMTTNVGGLDIFVTKYSSAGVFLWAKRFGSTQDQQATSVAIDISGNIIVTGWFYNSVNFGGGPLTSTGYKDIFLAKFLPDGAYMWSKRLGNTSDEIGVAVAVDSSSNVILAGKFAGTVDFGGGPLTSAGSWDIVLAKYSSTGTHIWSKRFGNANSQEPRSVATDGYGDIIIAGKFAGTVDFGGGVLTSASGNDIFLSKFSSVGTHLWSKKFGDTNTQQQANAVAADINGNIVITGYFGGTVDFGGGALTSPGIANIFLAKFTSTGAHTWSKWFGSNSSDFGEVAYGVALDSSGNVALTGSIKYSVDFGKGYLWTNMTYDIFVVKFNSSGAALWSKRAGAGYDDYGRSVVFDSNGNLLATGFFSDSANFGSGTLLSPGGYDSYLVKFTP